MHVPHERHFPSSLTSKEQNGWTKVDNNKFLRLVECFVDTHLGDKGWLSVKFKVKSEPGPYDWDPDPLPYTFEMKFTDDGRDGRCTIEKRLEGCHMGTADHLYIETLLGGDEVEEVYCYAMFISANCPDSDVCGCVVYF